MFGRWWHGGAVVAMWVGSGAVLATAADDHRRGLQAYQRGDVVAAMAALRGAAAAGHAPAQSLLAFILDRADFAAEALQLYRSAAAQDDAEGHAGLALMALTGRGIAKDENLALQHFSKAADLGHAASIQALAGAYLKNQLGLDAEGRDATAALHALRRAAEQEQASRTSAPGFLGQLTTMSRDAMLAVFERVANGDFGTKYSTAALARCRNKDASGLTDEELRSWLEDIGDVLGEPGK